MRTIKPDTLQIFSLRRLFISIISIVLVTSSCGQSDSPTNISPDEYVYNKPLTLDDGLNTDTLTNQGMNEEASIEIIKEILRDKFRKIDSILIYRNNRLLMEEYFNGYHKDRVHDIRSATKSITSLLVGIAIDKGFISGVDQKVYDTVDQYGEIDNWDPSKADINIEHLLTMSSGFECNGGWVMLDGKAVRLYGTDTWVKNLLDTPMRDIPGEVFSYCTGGIIALGEVIHQSSQKPVDDFSREYLFEPLGISNYRWEYSPIGEVDTGGHIYITARDMLKIGKLVLQEGVWQDKQIISKKWIEKSMQPYFGHYGYTWWRVGSLVENDNYLIYYADGNGGNRIFIVPRHDLIVVISGSNYNSEFGQASDYVLFSLILPQLDM